MGHSTKLSGENSPEFEALARNGQWLSAAAAAIFEKFGPLTEEQISNGDLDEFSMEMLDKIMLDVWFVTTWVAWNTRACADTRLAAIQAMKYGGSEGTQMSKTKYQAILRTWLLNIALPGASQPENQDEFEKWYWTQLEAGKPVNHEILQFKNL